jgi:nickel superoxide dismutase
MKINEVLAHCDIPCKIYDPIVIQIAALTVVRIIDIIEEKNLDTSKIDDSAELARLINEKENQAKIVKDETRIIWGDYFKDPQIEANPNVHSLVHSIMMQGSKCKQGLDRKNAETLVDLVNEFSEIFWSTKDVPTKRVKAPYPPALEMVVPNI